MKTQSAKAKGRRLQQKVAKLLNDLLGLDTKSLPMGSQGVDIIILGEDKKKFPYSIECKNQEKLNIWNAWNQAKNNTEENTKPLLVIKRNRSDTLVVMKLEDFLMEKKNEDGL